MKAFLKFSHKNYRIIILGLFVSSLALAQDNRLDRLYLNSLKQVKYYMVNGELNKAKLALERLQLYQSDISPVHLRYMAINQFLLGDYHKSRANLETIYRIGKKNRLYWIPKTCELHLLTLFNTDSSPSEVEQRWNNCVAVSQSRNMTPSPWLRILTDFHKNGSKLITPASHIKNMTDNELISALKLSLYLDQSKHLLEGLSVLKAKDLADPILRELIAEVYFRNNHLIKSLEALRGLNTVNSLVIRSDISILQNKYELAYATLKKAYSKKNYSQAVLDRIIPLAVLLDQMHDLEKFLDNSSRIHGVTPQIQSLAAYSYYNQKESKKADKLINEIEQKLNLSMEEKSLKAISAYQAKSIYAYEAGYNLCQDKSLYCWLPVLDAYQLKRSKSRKVVSRIPFDDFYNLIDEGSLSDQEKMFIDVDLLDEKRQFLDYLALRR